MTESNSGLTNQELREDAIPVAVVTPPPASQALTVTQDTATAGEVIQQQSSNQDYIVLRYAVLGLMITIWIALVGVVLLAYQNKEAPDGVIAAGSAAIGALATMIVRPPLYPPKN